MSYNFLKKILEVKEGILAIVLNTEGHTYKKKGDKTIFEIGKIFPVYGNLGAGCINEEILIHGEEVLKDKKFKIIKIDTQNIEDVYTGYGTYCGGIIEILIEPITTEEKRIYSEIMEKIEKEKIAYLIHDIKNSKIFLTEEIKSDLNSKHYFIEKIFPPLKMFIFGATPLAHEIINIIKNMDFKIYLIDWRNEYLKNFKKYNEIEIFKEKYPFDKNSFVLIISHNFLKDIFVIKKALEKNVRYIGLLSSRKRRDKIFEEILKQGFNEKDLKKICSPCGIDIKAREDREIAISIIAELIKLKNC